MENNVVWSIDPVVDWLFAVGCKMDDNLAFIREFGHCLNDHGAQADLMRIVLRTLHPQIIGATTVWSRETDAATQILAERQVRESDRFIGSPLQQLMETEADVRQRLDDLPQDAHGAYTELAAAGHTDYLAMPIITVKGYTAAFIVVTARPGGFRDGEIENLHRIREFLVPILEVQALRHLSRSLLNTYVGRRTGEKVLAGMIQRGDADLINAALWFSDLRNFTGLTESLAAEQVLAMLNDYFESVAAAIDAQTTLASLNHRRRRRGLPAIEFGVGLNVGEVIYGNVGAPDRLDFTVMGPAVNRTARLESLTKELGCNILFSEEFAGAVDVPVRAFPDQRMKGVEGTQTVFALDDDE